MTDAILIQQPAGTPEHLFLLLHGVGASADDLVPLGHFIANLFPRATVVSIDGLEPSDISAGRQWFSIRDMDGDSRSARSAAAMPAFVACIRQFQQALHADAQHTTLVGFSQGGIMALEATLLPEQLAGRVLALSSRFAALPNHKPNAQIHLIHGEQDSVIPCSHTLHAAARLHALGAGATADIVPGLDHGIDEEVLGWVGRRLGG